MRVALLSGNVQEHDAVGNQVALKARFFLERGADVRLFVQSDRQLHPDLHGLAHVVERAEAAGPTWDFLADADLVWAEYAQYFELLHFLPLLAGHKPRIVVEYHGITPTANWPDVGREMLERAASWRGLVWCADAVIAHSEFTTHELIEATGYPAARIHVIPCGVAEPILRSLTLPARQDGSLTAAARREHRLLFVGRVAPNKRLPVLIEALAKLGPGVQATVIGTAADIYADEAQRCRKRAAELGVGEQLHWRGQVSGAELAQAYREADVLVAPSLHEGFCIPVAEAMAAGLPVVAARAGALPETVGGAGFTFEPDNVHDLVQQLRRVLDDRGGGQRPAKFRVAVVSFRFGNKGVGGAETSLRTITETLQQGGHDVEIFTTCNRRESSWRNDLPAGTTSEDGLRVHRFPIDAHDRFAHDASFRTILESEGIVPAEVESRYLEHSLHASALVDALRRRIDDYDAIITGPYLFGLTYDLARAFGDKVLLAPCFHDEPLARLACWPRAYDKVAGILYHTEEEKRFAETNLGINHPRGKVVGTFLESAALTTPPTHQRGLTPTGRRMLVYCGRLTAQKNVPLLLEYLDRYERERPGRFECCFLGEGELEIPARPWLRALGWVGEHEKRTLLGQAAALVQLSRHESLSLVTIEAWAQGTPVIVHSQCAVLSSQVERAGGGVAVEDFASFTRALDDLWEHPDDWRRRGQLGQAYAVEHYGKRPRFLDRLTKALGDMKRPVAECMKERGLEWSRRCLPEEWTRAFAGVVETILETEEQVRRLELGIEPWQLEIRGAAGTDVLLAVRLVNRGTQIVTGAGPAGVTLMSQAVDEKNGTPAEVPRTTPAPDIIAPGQTHAGVVRIEVPPTPGEYRLEVWAESGGKLVPHSATVLRLGAVPDQPGLPPNPLPGLVGRALAEAQKRQQLPLEYVDVCEGLFARSKRWLKRKLLGNFKAAYVDVISRQQSQVNRDLIQAITQLSEYCRTLEHAVLVLQQQAKKVDVDQEGPRVHSER